MSSAIIDFFRSKFGAPPPVAPIERMMAKRWVKERLKHMYPELRCDPKALEEVYQSLSLEPRPGLGKGGEMMFEVIMPGRLDSDP
ncbi:hypothetical protein DB345_19575 [Spartobacteria bacterium LR76]|nr:hypothetical protein DB345_19575 [Spartobacteria bacterium LR76]